MNATYALEGDGLLVLICYDRILEIRGAIQSAYYPNVQAVVLPVQKQWIMYAMACVKPRIDYFHAQLRNDGMMKVFKAARLFSPHILQLGTLIFLELFLFCTMRSTVFKQNYLPTFHYQQM